MLFGLLFLHLILLPTHPPVRNRADFCPPSHQIMSDLWAQILSLENQINHHPMDHPTCMPFWCLYLHSRKNIIIIIIIIITIIIITIIIIIIIIIITWVLPPVLPRMVVQAPSLQQGVKSIHGGSSRLENWLAYLARYIQKKSNCSTASYKRPCTLDQVRVWNQLALVGSGSWVVQLRSSWRKCFIFW